MSLCSVSADPKLPIDFLPDDRGEPATSRDQGGSSSGGRDVVIIAHDFREDCDEELAGEGEQRGLDPSGLHDEASHLAVRRFAAGVEFECG